MISLNQSNSYFFINGKMSPDIVESLDRVLSYYVQNYEKTDVFQSGKWDGKEHLFRRAKNGSYYFPFGLIDNVIQVLSIWDIPFEVKSSRNARIEDVENDPDGFSLREYQREAIYKLVNNCYNSSGVIALPTAAGKTRCALWWAKKLNKPFIVIVHRKELMYQWRDAILDAGFTDYGLIGDGINDTFNHFVTIGMVQTLNNMDLSGVETGLLVIDECFTYDTIVKTDIGYLKIGDIVENKIKCNVLTHTGEYKPITNWYKKTSRTKMVKCIHDIGCFECTENHRILTNRGWIKAIDLSCRDYIYYMNDLQMQDMRKGIRNKICYWWAYKYSSLSPRIAIEKIKTILGRFIRRNTTYTGSKNTENPQCMVRQNRINRNTAAINIRKFDGRYGDIISKFSQQCPEVCNPAFFKAIPIRRLEICDNEKLMWNTSKTRSKQWLWNNELCIYNQISSVFKRSIRYCKGRWKNTIHREVAIGDKRSYSNNRMVFRRWLQNAKKRYYDIFRKDNSGRRRFIKRLAIERMGYSIKCISLYQRIKNWYISTKICKHIHANIARLFIYPSNNAIQNSVYDIEVADNHSYTANGVVVHNCHTIPSKTAYSVCMKIKADYRLGLSATPTRSDGAEMKIFACCGTIAASISVEQLVEGGYLAAPIFRMENLSPVRLKYNESWQNVYKQGIVLNFERNERISQIAEEYLSKGRQVYIHVNQIDHGKCLTGMIDGAVFVCGSTKKSERADIIEGFKSGKIRCLVSTLLREGVSIDGISCLIMGSAGRSPISLIQTIGRALRMDIIFKDSIIIDFIDRGHRVLENHTQERISIYREAYGSLFNY